MRRFRRAITVMLLAGLAARGGNGSDRTKAAPRRRNRVHAIVLARVRIGGSISLPPSLSRQTPAHGEQTRSAANAGVDPHAKVTTRGTSQVVRWIKNMGITGGGSWEGNAAAYDAIAREDCDDVFRVEPTSFDNDMKQLYYGAVWACLAAFEGQRAHWTRAESAYMAMSDRNHDFGCLEVAAYQILRDLVQAHRSEPDARFVKGSGSNAAAPLCPRIRKVEPDHGPARGGYKVRLVGENLPFHATILWNSDTIAVTTATDREATIAVPPGAPGDGVMVIEQGWQYGIAGAPWFEYDPSGASVGPALPDD
ncbi:MAG TPA: IPT/TIG domain-containing protein [Actinomycetes bacterium]|jgi:hypothetical protein|nr:IPT/TIG domain-containing protein [Actinomycetes bacterium]